MSLAPSARHSIAVIAGMIVGGVYLSAALVKGLDPGLFVEQIRGYRVLPSGWAPAAAAALVALEGWLGVLLIAGIWRRPVALLGAALMATFMAATAWAWAHGNASSCGCFGRLAERGPMGVILEDGLFLILLLLAFRFDRSGDVPRWRLASGLAGGVLLSLLPWVGPALPVDPWVTSLRPGADLKDMAADDLKFPLAEGRVLVALLGPDCEACDGLVPELDLIADRDGGPRVTAIFAGDRRAKREWQLRVVPGFPVAHAPEKALRQYFRRLPVVFLLEEGVVRRVWWDRAPAGGEL